MATEDNKELVMRAIADMKSVLAGQQFDDAESMARAYLKQNGNSHGNWDILYPEVKLAFTKLAEAAMYELKTGKILTE
jgi:hypothetical protein